MKSENARSLVDCARGVEANLNDPARAWQQKIIASRGTPEVFRLVRLKALAEYMAVGLYRKDGKKLCLVLFTFDTRRGWQDHIVNAADVAGYVAIGELYNKVEAFNFPYNITRMIDEGRAPFVDRTTVDDVVPVDESIIQG